MSNRTKDDTGKVDEDPNDGLGFDDHDDYGDVWYSNVGWIGDIKRLPGRPRPKFVPRPGYREIEPANPPCGYYHYSNKNSQNSLITKTRNYPREFHPDRFDFHHAYADRLQSWDWDHYQELCKKHIGSFEQGWASAFRNFSDDKLCEIAKFAFKLNDLPKHVRVVHHFNVSSGYSCPTIECLSRKKKS